MLSQFGFMKALETNTQIQQELVNSIVQGFGIIFGIVGMPILIAFPIKSNNIPSVIGAVLYGCFLRFLLFRLFTPDFNMRWQRLFAMM